MDARRFARAVHATLRHSAEPQQANRDFVFRTPVETEIFAAACRKAYEMFDAASVPFLGDYNWIQLAQADGSLFGYMT
jgi:hypothetical protein